MTTAVYDAEAGAVYVRLREGASARQEEVGDRVILDYSVTGLLLGVEVLEIGS